MQMYPNYRLRDVLDEYATAFFALLEYGYRNKFSNYQILARISILPNMEEAQQEEFLRVLNMAVNDPRDILESDENQDYSGLETLKGMLK